MYLENSFTAVWFLCGYNVYASYKNHLCYCCCCVCIGVWSVGVLLKLDFDEATTRNTYKRNERNS